MARRRRVLAAVGVLAACVGGGAAVALLGGPSFSEPLVDGDGASERVDLADGSELAVTVVDGEFVVQWREAGGSWWTGPEPVVPGLARDADEISVDVGGSTAMLGLTSYSVLDDEQEGGGRTDAVVCRAYDCDTSLLGVTGPPEVTEDGEYAVALDEPDGKGYTDDDVYDLARWDLDSGEWSPVQVTDPVPPDDAVRPELVLLGDGALATVRSEPRAGADGCRFDLWATEPYGVELERVATTDPVAGTTSCSFQSVETDGEDVSFLAYDVERTVTVTRGGDRWRALAVPRPGPSLDAVADVPPQPAPNGSMTGTPAVSNGAVSRVATR